jgi:3-methyladenine DNA glycosylase AlkD
MTNNLIQNIENAMAQYSSQKRAKDLQRFFKTKPGEYGEGDVFIGIDMPTLRSIAKSFSHISLSDLKFFITSKIHEYRSFALICLEIKYNAAFKIAFHESKNTSTSMSGEDTCAEDVFMNDVLQIVRFYTDHVDYINNWDLVDISAPKILGHYYYNESILKNDFAKKLLVNKASTNEKTIASLLNDYSEESSLWKNRIAVVSTLYLIKHGHFDVTLKFAEKLINHKHDLMHKAIGWMLREIGSKDLTVLENFLSKFASVMPITMLRYAIEKFRNRNDYLAIKRNIIG